MKTKICTSIEQSKKLLELGLNPETADIFWEVDKNCIGVKAYNLIPAIRWSEEELMEMFKTNEELIPAWSLSALLGLIPHENLWGIELSNYGNEVVWTSIFQWKKMG